MMSMIRPRASDQPGEGEEDLTSESHGYLLLLAVLPERYSTVILARS